MHLKRWGKWKDLQNIGTLNFPFSSLWLSFCLYPVRVCVPERQGDGKHLSLLFNWWVCVTPQNSEELSGPRCTHRWRSKALFQIVGSVKTRSLFSRGRRERGSEAANIKTCDSYCGNGVCEPNLLADGFSSTNCESLPPTPPCWARSSCLTRCLISSFIRSLSQHISVCLNAEESTSRRRRYMYRYDFSCFRDQTINNVMTDSITWRTH